MNELKNWAEITKGLYRYVIGSNISYEIHILKWDHKTDIMSANTILYLAGDWRYGKESFFEREFLLNGPLIACIQAAVDDIHARLPHLDRDDIEAVLEVEEEYMRNIGIIIEEADVPYE